MDRGSTTDGDRAVSSPVGVVLLLAVTIAAVTVTVVAGSAALGAVTDDARSSGAENALSQLSSQTSLVALGETDTKRFDLGSVDGGDLRLEEDAGHVRVWIERGGEVDPVFDDSFGTLVYEGDRRTVAMQGGGVWTADGDRGRMVSPPEYHYRGDTLTFPIVRLEGDGSAPAARGTVRQKQVGASVFDPGDNPLQDGTVVVEVRSDYYEGWYDFFSQRAEGDVTKDDDARTVTARLVVPEEVAVDKPLSIGGGGYDYRGQDPLHEDDYETGQSHPSPSTVIANQLSIAQSDGDGDVSNCFDGGTCSAGTYYADGDVTLDGDVDFDTTDGDVVVAIDGTFDIGGHNLQITDETDNEVRYYIDGDLELNNPRIGTTATSTDAKRTQFYVNGGVAENTNGIGNAEIDAIIYAPNAFLEVSGNPTLRGAFVFGGVDLGGAADVQHDPELADFQLTITGGPGQNPITYLHVSENVVEVGFD
ncbi:hypothetical protein GRS48_06495 [Halorubrum sp. JWXQ-INN 858]|uniref:DUF7289 family protein n=1 Tax=Halorubrum sp. JWXQ-INN 858 TaxID=2690782 RepID=UPI00135B62FB|nr:archaellin/type IV pilin N-terminal domain-containing protein [Halorubrum sp. JWXQ-INN 858]MWV64473.1 hypothetical protein [Halorubrum sp. JWXQ-INN 858]